MVLIDGATDVGDAEPQCLHPVEGLGRHTLPVEFRAQRDKLIEQRRKLSSLAFSDPEHLKRFAVGRLGELPRIKPVPNESCVLPEHLIDEVVGVCVDDGHRDLPLWSDATQSVRSQQDHVTDSYRGLGALPRQHRTAVAEHHEFHAVIGDWRDRLAQADGASQLRRRDSGVACRSGSW